MSDIPAPPPLPHPYKDRHKGLVGFGVFAIVIGGFTALFVPMLLIASLVAAHAESEARRGPFPFAILVYALIAAAAIWLGIGSIKARRWARALILVVSVMVLLAGVAEMIMLPLLIPKAMQAASVANGRELPAASATLATAVSMAIAFGMLIVIPGLFILFYRLRDVKLTCEARDPVPRWTDACPLPVLGLCLMQAFGGLSVLFIAFRFPFFPLFGLKVLGTPATLLWLAFGGFSLYAAVGFYRLRSRAWWVYTVGMAIYGVSNVTSYGFTDAADILMGRFARTPQEATVMHSLPWHTGGGFVWMTVGSIVPVLVYLLFLRRYFVRSRNGITAVPALRT